MDAENITLNPLQKLATSLIKLLTKVLPSFIVSDNVVVKNKCYETLFHSSVDAFLVFNKSTREIVDYNSTVLSLFEIPEAQNLKGTYISQVMMRYLSGNSSNFEILMGNIPNNWNGEGQFVTHNKKEFSGFVHTTSFYKSDKEFQILCVRDISNLKQPEVELNKYKEILKNSTKVKSRFLSSISHELRTPLNGIIGTSNLILEDEKISANAKEQLKLQLYSAEHMLSIVNDILDFSKIDRGKMVLNKQSFNLLETLQTLIKSFENQFVANKIGLHFIFPPELDGIKVISDEVKLRQVLSNLISNALKFTLEGSVTITVKVENSDEENIAVSFSIKDSGIGIKKESQKEIFEGFTQVHAEDLKRRFGGTGLGLTISQKLVNLFGGKIVVESELGKGADFFFKLSFNKCTKKSQPILEEEFQDIPVDIRGVRVLIVEDNEINILILKSFLKKWDIRIMEASNGVQALELLKYHKFDMVLMDLEMPEMDGYTATKIIRKTDATMPIIAFTATLLENMDLLITESGFNDYILKPFKPANLKKKIEIFAHHRRIEYA